MPLPPSSVKRCPEGAEVGSSSGINMPLRGALSYAHVRQSLLPYRHPERSRGIFVAILFLTSSAEPSAWNTVSPNAREKQASRFRSHAYTVSPQTKKISRFRSKWHVGKDRLTSSFIPSFITPEMSGKLKQGAVKKWILISSQPLYKFLAGPFSVARHLFGLSWWSIQWINHGLFFPCTCQSPTK